MAIIVNQDYIEKCKIQSAQQLESAIQGALQLANNTLTLIEKELRMPEKIVLYDDGTVKTTITPARLEEMDHADFMKMDHRDLASLCAFAVGKLIRAQIECQN